MPINMVKLPTKKPGVYLRVAQGHFATSHSHMNYFIDITMQKTCLQEALAVARELVPFYRTRAIVDTIICLDGTEVIGACIANEMTRMDVGNINANQQIFVVTPEHTSGSQLLFRENIAPMIDGKNVLILAASVVTGYTAKAAIEAINYYNGQVAGVASIFSTSDSYEGYPVVSLFNPNDLPDYLSFESHNCPMCRAGKKIDALVNCYGYSKL